MSYHLTVTIAVDLSPTEYSQLRYMSGEEAVSFLESKGHHFSKKGYGTLKVIGLSTTGYCPSKNRDFPPLFFNIFKLGNNDQSEKGQETMPIVLTQEIMTLPIVESVECMFCKRLIRADSEGYIAIHGNITIGRRGGIEYSHSFYRH